MRIWVRMRINIFDRKWKKMSSILLRKITVLYMLSRILKSCSINLHPTVISEQRPLKFSTHCENILHTLNNAIRIKLQTNRTLHWETSPNNLSNWSKHNRIKPSTSVSREACFPSKRGESMISPMSWKGLATLLRLAKTKWNGLELPLNRTTIKKWMKSIVKYKGQRIDLNNWSEHTIYLLTRAKTNSAALQLFKL